MSKTQAYPVSETKVDFSSTFYVNAVKSSIRKCLINQKANSCPMAVRLAWHASGTYSAADQTGGSDGATMRFAPESEDGANAGLGIERDVLEPVKREFPELSYADIWTLAGCVAIEESGGPKIGTPRKIGAIRRNSRNPPTPDPPPQSTTSAAPTPRRAPRARWSAGCPTPRRARSTSATSSTGWASTTATSSR